MDGRRVSAARELAHRLRSRRLAWFATGSGLARQLGWSQSKVSRIETGSVLPSEDDLRRWTAATAPLGTDDGPDGVLVDLLAAARRREGHHGPPADAVAGGRRASWLERYAHRVDTDEALPGAIREYAVGLLPMLVRTPDLVAAWAGEMDLDPDGPSRDEFVQRLLGLHTRHRALLYESRQKAPGLLIEEMALHRCPAGPDAHRGQLRHLTQLLDASAVDLRIVPRTADPAALPLSSFTLYPRRVLVETVGGDCWFQRVEDIAAFERAFAGARRAAVAGSQAADLIAEADATVARSAVPARRVGA